MARFNINKYRVLNLRQANSIINKNYNIPEKYIMVNEAMLALGTSNSVIRELFEYGNARAAAVGRENVYDFSIGNPSVPAPTEVNRAFVSIIESVDSLRVHGYTPAAGVPEARIAVADDLNARYGTKLKKDNIFFTCGAAPALVSVIRALAVDGAEIIGIQPCFPEYVPFAEANGARFVPVKAEAGTFQPDVAALSAGISAHTQAVIVNSPNNPTGVVYTRESLEAVAVLLRRKSVEYGHPIYIIADEPYRELVFDGSQALFIPTIYKNTIVCYSYSKSLSLPGERVGYVCVPDTVEDSRTVFAAIAGAARAGGHVCAPSLQQRVVAMCAASRPNVETYRRNSLYLYDKLTAMGYRCVRPDGAFYMFVKAPGGDAKAFSDAARAHDLLVVPGGDFGCPDYFRVSTCVSYDMIRRSIPAFEAVLAEF